MFKKVSALLLSLAMLLTAIPDTTYAATATASCTSYFAKEMTVSVLKSYLGKSRDAIVKDLKTRDVISWDEVDYTEMDLKVNLINDNANDYYITFDGFTCVGVTVKHGFWVDENSTAYHSAFVRKANQTYAEMKKYGDINFDDYEEEGFYNASGDVTMGKYHVYFTVKWEPYDDGSTWTETALYYELAQ